MSMYLGPGGRRGRPAGSFRLCAFDLDGVAELVGPDVEFLTEQLAAVGIPVVKAASGPGPGRHVWTRCRDEIPASLVKRIVTALTGADGRRPLCPTLDAGPLLNPATGCVRVPGSPHRNGGYSRLLEHSPDEAIAVLRRGAPLLAYKQLAERLEQLAGRMPPRRPATPAPPGQTHRVGEHQPRHAGAGRIRRLPPSLFRHGEPVRPIARDAGGRLRLELGLRTPGEATQQALQARLDPAVDHSAHAFRVLKGLALAGFTHAAVVQLVNDPDRSPGLEWLRTTRSCGGAALRVAREGWDRSALLARQWDLAVEAAARVPAGGAGERDPAPDVTAAVVDLLRRMDAAGTGRWTRPSGPADRATLLAIAVVMLTASRLEVSLDVRRAALMTGYSRQTANEAMRRLIADGWLCEAAPADRRRSQARTLGLAADHVCNTHHRHECAMSSSVADIGNSGSDTRANARPPEGLGRFPSADLYSVKGGGRQLADSLRIVLGEVRSDLWGMLGHHAAWTLQAVRDVPRTAQEMERITGYSSTTTAKHLASLTRHGLVCKGPHGWQRTGRDVADAVRELPDRHRTRSVDRAVVYAVERAVHRWWSAEVAWMRLSRPEKRVRGRRAPADQTTLPGLAATARAYPRQPDGTPDHDRAWMIEATRLEAAALAAATLHQLDVGTVVDPLRLLGTERLEPTAPTAVNPAA
ncbi:hypothetical protein [Actinomadura violacea]|uniref:Uncharacterized protein n=1 Tax=Actinomadura violacea TaxID=2819934 RepID=A0ABS3S7F6_9ACTN|nr:hypothetical protein [Actinomadura violacea]MBO2464932.1 hypothetical protein [Actinomadura violacea]